MTASRLSDLGTCLGNGTRFGTIRGFKRSRPPRNRRRSTNNAERGINRQKRELLLASRIRNDTLLSAPPFACSFLSNGDWARARARMVARFTEGRSEKLLG